MAVHRISDRAELALKQIIELEGGKPSDVISNLLIDYAAGKEFPVRRTSAVYCVHMSPIHDRAGAEEVARGRMASLRPSPGRPGKWDVYLLAARKPHHASTAWIGLPDDEKVGW